MAVLITAFTPFGGSAENTSAKVLRLLPEGVSRLLLPTSYKRSFEILRAELCEREYSAVVLTGEASRSKITVERVAINVADASLPDNDGAVFTDAPLEEGGPAACFATLPIKKMAEAGGADVSNTAGTYVCNALMYRALRFTAGKTPCGFVHLPKGGDAAELAEKLMKMVDVL